METSKKIKFVKEGSFSHLKNLPNEQIIEIALGLDDESVFQLCRVSSHFNAILCEDDRFWKEKFGKQYKDKFTSKRIKKFKELYKIRKLLLRDLEKFIVRYGPDMDTLPHYIKINIPEFAVHIFEEMIENYKEYKDDNDDNEEELLYLIGNVFSKVLFPVKSNLFEGDALYNDNQYSIYESYDFVATEFQTIYDKVIGFYLGL